MGTKAKAMNGCYTGLNWTTGQPTVGITRYQH
jgi:hypothetical protein